MSDLQTVLKLLPKLTSEELGQVRVAMGALGAAGPAYVKPGIRAEDDASWLLSIVRDVFPDQPIPVHVLRKSRIYPSFAQKLPAVMTWIKHALERRVEQQALLNVALTLMRHDLAAQGTITVSPTLIMSNIHMLPATIDRHFPGYVESGLIGLVLRTEAKA